MDPQVQAALVAILGTILGVIATALFDRLKAKDQSAATRAQHLRDVCAMHASNLSRYRAQARLEGKRPRAAVEYQPSNAFVTARADAAVSMELLRLTSGSIVVQEQARLALRHAYAIWQTSIGRPDPRGNEYPPNQTPEVRFAAAFKQFLIESRRELGEPHPEAVYGEP